MSATWTDRRWLDEAQTWIRAHVAPTAPIEQPHVRPWSTVLRVPTAEGDVFFKANAPLAVHEAEVLERLSPVAPNLLPELVAVDESRRWLLLRDAGERLRDDPGAARWADILTAYADLQHAAAPLVPELIAGGVPDRRLPRLPELYERLGGDARVVTELCAKVEPLGLADTIQHDDLHDGQVFVRDRRARILDWGDACVGPPLATLGVAGDFADDDAVDAYLACWGEPAELRPAVAAARRLAGVSRALTWAAVGENAGPDEQGHYRAGVQMWIRRVATPPDAWTAGF